MATPNLARLAQQYSDGTIDRSLCFSVACACYWYLTNYHGEQWSPEYAALCSLDYRPGACESGPAPETTDSDIYAELEHDHKEGTDTAIALVSEINAIYNTLPD